ncbi:putative beta-glucosidase 9 [Anoplophora glabripennis]|uniref:putative beta-glucosidase 9 n=1 Tax=Anoplophora glabripennis TaxID=217634 RepID=UPI0008744996|nr:putative beta-glucosidase 9 [Anoplophora glabripennis]
MIRGFNIFIEIQGGNFISYSIPIIKITVLIILYAFFLQVWQMTQSTLGTSPKTLNWVWQTQPPRSKETGTRMARDYWAHNYPEKIADRFTPDIACYFYHKYKEDVALVKAMGLDYYHLSIAWSRILKIHTKFQSHIFYCVYDWLYVST